MFSPTWFIHAGLEVEKQIDRILSFEASDIKENTCSKWLHANTFWKTHVNIIVLAACNAQLIVTKIHCELAIMETHLRLKLRFWLKSVVHENQTLMHWTIILNNNARPNKSRTGIP